jgi:hypothetical protein
LAALEVLDNEEEINSVREMIGDNIRISVKEGPGHYEQKKHKTWFDTECSKLLDRRKQANLPWLWNPSEINGDNLNSSTYS